ncbi:hypothetical protein [Sphingobacterium phlebotomi]|uniref:hypothetical protein n=1 Tax=Sphingobacterium phlebotomi TaxID=2605433 RepID=UPI001FE3FAD2|nr:hypothetical protein [Sphingobacterium phlebotomi]
MKKSIFILLAIFVAVTAQAQPFQKGTTTANVGIGLGTVLGGLGKARPAISASVDHGVWPMGGPGVISMGGYIGNTGYKYTDLGYTAKWNYNVIGVRGAYHYNGFTTVPNLDVYGGVMLGYNIVKYSSDSGDDYLSGNYGSGVGFSGFLGGRWFFGDSFGAYAELGYGVSVLNAGLTFKF